jgi:hypothetical protein
MNEMKVALCFNIHYKNTLIKEKIWKEWVYYNRDIINIYFHYNQKTPIKSQWIKKHIIPKNYLKETSYYYVVPALMSLLSFAYCDTSNKWFCLLTDSCVPMISPKEFRNRFFHYYSYTIFRWYSPNWNIQYQKRANLFQLSEKYHLANDPWFIITRYDVLYCLKFTKNKMYKTITKGIIANESVFAIALAYFSRLQRVINKSSTLCDWTRMNSPTSPYIFKMNSNLEKDKKYILENDAIFLRKVHSSFPDKILEDILYSSFKRTKYNEKDLSNVLYRSFQINPYWFIFLIAILLSYYFQFNGRMTLVRN